MSEERGHFMQTVSGIKFYPMAPWPEDVCIGDMAHHLSHVCRFAGAVRAYYSVAQHSVLVARQLFAEPAKVQLWGLLHDASEAYVGDMVRPLKLHMDEYRACEKQVMKAICEHFRLENYEPRLVKYYDQILCVTEARDLMGNPEWAEHGPIAPLKEIIDPWPPAYAAREFLATYAVLAEQVAADTRKERMALVG